MSKEKIIIPTLLKEKILLESDKPGCVMYELAAEHNIPARTIYDWRRARNKSSWCNILSVLSFKISSKIYAQAIAKR
jgi:hypothetical protein